MKKVFIITGVVIIVLVIAFFGFKMYTKSHSPQESISFKDKITVDYSRPYKKDREIFGELVPYDEVWRTGANEATVLTISSSIKIGAKDLEAGKYSLFTIPGAEEWTIIINSETGQWGVNSEGANRNPEKDILQVIVPSITSDQVIEQFTILFEEVKDEVEMVMMWDNTIVAIPITF